MVIFSTSYKRYVSDKHLNFQLKVQVAYSESSHLRNHFTSSIKFSYNLLVTFLNLCWMINLEEYGINT